MKERPGILVIGPTPPPHHGVSMATQALLESDLSREFRLILVDLADRRGIEHVDKPDLYDAWLFLFQWSRMMRALLLERPRMVYLAISQQMVGFLRDSLFILPSALVGRRVVLHLHGSNFRHWYDNLSAWARLFVRFVIRRADRVIVLGESLRPLFTGLLPSERLAVVPNGIPWGTRSARQVRTHVPRRFRVLYFGTLSRSKGVFILMEAILSVLQVRKDAEFVFAGPWYRPEEQAHALGFIHRYCLDAHVTFTGAVTTAEEKQRIYESADLFVFPGVQQEGQPLVVLEAMAAGLPVIFTNRGCLRETVIEGHNGWEVPLNDPEAIARRIIWFMTQVEERDRMACESRRRYEQLYTLERFASNVARVLTELHEGSRRCAASLASTPGQIA